MAKRVESVLVDDMDGSEPATTVNFGLHGVEYEIDLTESNDAALEAALAEFIKCARRVGGVRRRSNGRRAHLQAARQWARQNGHDIGERGRIPSDLLKQFEQAQSVAS